MKRSRKISTLSRSINRQLNMYTLAASAAGVGVLASVTPADAKIVYTPANEKIVPNHIVGLDLNHDGIVDFSFKDVHFTTQVVSHHGILSLIPAVAMNQAEGYSEFGRAYASALGAGVTVGPKGHFRSGPRVMAMVYSDTGAHHATAYQCDGPWGKAGNHYLGLEFLVNGETHFGWARLSMTCFANTVRATLSGYAYESTPNQPIITGKTQGADDGNEEEAATPQGSTWLLGELALGQSGLQLWRRED